MTWQSWIFRVACMPLLFTACSVSGASTSARQDFDSGVSDVGRDTYYAEGSTGGTSSAGAGNARNPLCGIGCIPDNALACAPAAAGGTTGNGDAGGAGAQNTASGAAGGLMQAGLGSGTGGETSDAASPQLPGYAGAAGAANGITLVACQVQRTSSGPSGSCAPAGTAGNNDPCNRPSDCKPGFACVSDANVARCLPYCCEGSEASCESGTYCAERPLKNDTSGDEDPLMLPVCVAAAKCNLSEPYPCPLDTQCTCTEGTACTVVRADGTTSCVAPGEGVEGDACPCASGYICSQATTTCLKLCSLSAYTQDCGSRRCQVSSNLPDNWGVCVGEMSDGG